MRSLTIPVSRRPIGRFSPALLGALVLAGCIVAPSAAPEQTGGGQPPAPRSEARSLNIVVRVEPATVAARPFQQPGAALHMSRRIFNALPALIDAQGLPRPYLLESLPALNTDGWRVFPDGQMESVYRLKAGIRWHDGTPLTAEDFVFSWRTYTTVDLGHANAPPFHAMEEVTAADDRTFRIRWKLPYPDAATLSARDREMPALPRHVLGAALEQVPTAGTEAFTSNAYWSREYVGLGPYRMERWEPAAFIDAVRFDGHILGAARIERVQLRFSADGNVALAGILAGEIHLATDNGIPQNPEVLRQEWASRGGAEAGTILRWPNAWRHTAFQLRPDYANPRAILDPRVRKAIAHAVDKAAIGEAVYGGEAIFADTPVWSGSEWGAALDPERPTYAFDLRRSEQLMNQAGFAKAPDGIYTPTPSGRPAERDASPSEGRFVAETQTQEGADNVPELLIVADGLRRAGFEAREHVLPAAQAQDGQVRATFSAMATSNTSLGEPALIALIIDGIPSPQNRWRGGNRGGWANAEYSRLVTVFNRTLERSDRLELVAQLLKIYGEELPLLSIFFRAQPFAHVAALRGPVLAAPESSMAWNIHEWEWR